MPRPKQKTAFLGEQTVRILLGVPLSQAGWLIHALCDWIENHREPTRDETPDDCIGSWIAIRDESVRIHESRKQQTEAGRSGGKANPKRTASEPEANPQRTANEPATNGNQEEEMKTKKENISSDVRCPDVARERASRPSSIGVGHRSSVDSSIRIPSPSENFVVWAKLQEDPVDVAMCATGETDKRARRTYGAQLKRLGRERFVELVCDFHSTLAEEPPRNKGATLTAFLRDTP